MLIFEGEEHDTTLEGPELTWEMETGSQGRFILTYRCLH